MPWRELPLPAEVEALGSRVKRAALIVHREVGPGFREATYQRCLAHLLRESGHEVKEFVSLDVDFRGLRLHDAAEVDMIVDDLVVVELKAREAFHPTHSARTVSYLRQTGIDLGLLFNFHAVTLLKHGYRRLVHPRHLVRE